MHIGESHGIKSVLLNKIEISKWTKKVLNGTIVKISSDPTFQEGMSDSHRYPLNLYLIHNEKDIIVFFKAFSCSNECNHKITHFLKRNH